MIQINSVPIPFANRGEYIFTKIPNKPYGSGHLVRSGVQSAIWTFDYLTVTEMNTLEALITPGEDSITTTATLWDQWYNEFAFTEVTMYRPTTSGFTENMHQNVEVIFTFMLPIVASWT